MRTATSLLAKSAGDEPCFYCGAPASAALKLSAAFTEWWSVPHPESSWVCQGCQWMLEEKRSIPGKSKPQKTRNYSWLIESDKQTPLTKADKRRIADVLLSPPDPPWALALAESGQRHLLHRTQINRDSEPPYTVQLELESIHYEPCGLASRMDLARRVVAKVGHNGAKEAGLGLAIVAGAELAEQWIAVADEPLSRLAMFVTPSQKECQVD